MPDFDYIIAGAGLAGTAAALSLSKSGSVLLVDQARPASGGSGVAAGLINPILGLRARPVWRVSEALSALEELLDGAGARSLLDGRSTLRPATDPRQQVWFSETAAEYPGYAQWLDPAAVSTTYPDVHAPHGGLLITRGGAIDLASLVGRLVDELAGRGVSVLTHAPLARWDEQEHAIRVELGLGEAYTARYLLLALGAGFVHFPELRRLKLHRIKGQIVRLSRPPGLSADLPHVAGSGYIVLEQGSVLAGTTYEHEFTHLEPVPHQTQAIISAAAAMVPSLRGATILEERAGVRVTVPRIRLPMVGPLPGRTRVWIFTGLGAKGLLTAPLVARELPEYLDVPAQIPRETRVRLHTS